VTGASEAPSHWRWREDSVGPGPTVIFDIDGVLSDAVGRQHYLEGARRDWRSFFDACGDDPLIEEVGRLLLLLDEALHIVLLTARPLRVQEQTVGWLDRYRLRWDLLIMRGNGDYTYAEEFKRQSVDELRAAGLDPVLAFEDDPKNVAMLRAASVPCVYLHSGYYG
jgi:hypothetical protein